MTTFPRVSPRRLSGKEESELLDVAERLASAEAQASGLLHERDRLIADVVQAGARVTDVANVLGMNRASVYLAIERAARRD